MNEYEPFDLRFKFGEIELSSLEWREVKPPSTDGRRWLVRERGGKGISFAVYANRRVLHMVGLGEK